MTTADSDAKHIRLRPHGLEGLIRDNACGYEGKVEDRRNRVLFFAALEASIFFLEFLNTPRGINQFLLASEIRMAGGTNLDPHFAVH